MIKSKRPMLNMNKSQHRIPNMKRTYIYEHDIHTTVSTENATLPESSKFRNSNSSVQIQIEPNSQFEFV